MSIAFSRYCPALTRLGLVLARLGSVLATLGLRSRETGLSKRADGCSPASRPSGRPDGRPDGRTEGKGRAIERQRRRLDTKATWSSTPGQLNRSPCYGVKTKGTRGERMGGHGGGDSRVKTEQRSKGKTDGGRRALLESRVDRRSRGRRWADIDRRNTLNLNQVDTRAVRKGWISCETTVRLTSGCYSILLRSSSHVTRGGRHIQDILEI